MTTAKSAQLNTRLYTPQSFRAAESARDLSYSRANTHASLRDLFPFVRSLTSFGMTTVKARRLALALTPPPSSRAAQTARDLSYSGANTHASLCDLFPFVRSLTSVRDDRRAGSG